MGGRRLIAACCISVLGSLLGAAAASAAAVPGAAYHGPGPKQYRTSIRVSKTGTRLASYRIPFVERCSNGRRHSGYLVSLGEKPTSVAADGTFRYSTPKERGRVRYGKHVYTDVFTSTFKGTFVSADVIKGHIDAKTRNAKYTCTASYDFTAYRDGTPGAPFRTPLLATGKYAASGSGVRLANLRVNAPGSELSDGAKIATKVRCRGGGYLSDRLSLDSVPLVRGRLSIGTRFRTRVDRNPARQRVRIKLRFYRRGSAYRVRGSIRDVYRVYRHRKRVAYCASTRRFTGRFLSGPR